MIAQISAKKSVAETFEEFLRVIRSADSPEQQLVAESPLTKSIFYAGAQASFGMVLNVDAEDLLSKGLHTAALLNNLAKVRAELASYAMTALALAFERLYEEREGQSE